MFGIGMQELLIVAVVALLVVGPKRLPEVAQMLGKGYAQLRKAADDLQGSLKAEMDVKRAEELKKKYPHLAVEDAGEKPAPTPGAAGPGETADRVPSHFGEGDYGLSDDPPGSASVETSANKPAPPQAIPGLKNPKKDD